MGNGGCIDPTSAVPPIDVESCLGDKVCTTETRYARPNSSIPFESKPTFIERSCRPRRSPMCDFSPDAPCKMDGENDMYVCYSCCDGDKCNTNIPTFSAAPTSQRTSHSLLIVCFALFSFYLL